MIQLAELRARCNALAEQFNSLWGRLDLPAKEARLEEIEQFISSPEAWNDQEKMTAILKEKSRVEAEVARYRELQTAYEETQEWLGFVSDGEEDALETLNEQADLLEKLLTQTEMTVLGESNDSGVLRVWHNGECVVEMDNSKLHDAPVKKLTSVFTKGEARTGITLDDSNLAGDLKQLFGDFAIVSREPIIREYDHEVQGNTVLKPLAGASADAPQDASVIDIDGSDKLMSLALAILPEWGKTDPYAMGTGTVDETVRQLVLAGTNPDKIALLDNFCMGNPEEPTELGRIVECAKGIREAALAFGAPYVSGKDSFYNYFETEDGPVNIPVTFLCSGFGVVEEPEHVRGASLRRNNSAIFIVGNTEDEMGGSVYARVKGVKDCKVPQTDCAANDRHNT